MAAGHRQGEVLDGVDGLPVAVAEQHCEGLPAAVVAEIGEPHVGLRIFAVGDDAAVLDAADQALHDRMIGAHHGEAVERHVLDEGAERILHRDEGLEVVEMLGVDVGDDGDVGRQLQERAVGFVGLDHHPVAGAEPGVGAVGVDDAAVDHGRIEIRGIEQRRDERRRRGLAVGAGDGDAAFQPHQLGQHLGAAHHRQALLAGGNEFRVVALDRRRHHQHLGAVEVLRLVADGDLGALVAQPLDVGVVARVRALHRIAEVDQHLGDAAHADAADANEMDRPDFARQFHRRRSLWWRQLPRRRYHTRHPQHQIGEPVGGVDRTGRLGGRRHGGEAAGRPRPRPRSRSRAARG